MSRTDVWSDEDKERIRKLWEGGWSGGRIGKELGVSRNCIIGLAHRNGWRQSGAGERLPACPFRKPKPKTEKPSPLKPIAPVIEPKEVETMPTPIVAHVSHRATIMELREGMCKFPMEGRGIEMRFCGARSLDRMNGSVREPYCGHHAKIAYTKAGKPQSEEANLKRRFAMMKVGQDAFAPARAKKAAKAS